MLRLKCRMSRVSFSRICISFSISVPEMRKPASCETGFLTLDRYGPSTQSTFVTFSAAGPFWPCTMSNSTR